MKTAATAHTPLLMLQTKKYVQPGTNAQAEKIFLTI